jgi:hypothetical protein
MPTKFKIFAIAAALAAGTSSAAMEALASVGYRLPDTCTEGYIYYNGLCLAGAAAAGVRQPCNRHWNRKYADRR